MRSTVLMISGALLFAPIFLSAQEATDVDLQATATPEPSATIAPTPATVPELSQLDEAFKQTSLGKAGDESRLRVEWRKLRNKVANDPDLIAAKKAAEATRTDLEKRDRLRAYYKLYFARIRRLPMTPEMNRRLKAMEAQQLGLTAQSRVRPSPTAIPDEDR